MEKDERVVCVGLSFNAPTEFKGNVPRMINTLSLLPSQSTVGQVTNAGQLDSLSPSLL